MTPSRFAICSTGSGYTVEDRKTGERVSYHHTWAAALAAAKAASEEYSKLLKV